MLPSLSTREERHPVCPKRTLDYSQFLDIIRHMELVSIEEIRDAASRIKGAAVRTPLLRQPWAPLWLKPESLQEIGAFDPARRVADFLDRNQFHMPDYVKEL